MSYYFYCEGQLQLDHQLTPEHHAFLKRFAQTRRMKRHVDKIVFLPDPLREAVNLPVGPEGAYYVAGDGVHGEIHDDTIADYNREPDHQPDLWCPWHPSEDGLCLEPDDCINNHFNAYATWLNYLIKHFLGPWGYLVSGSVMLRGEDWDQSKMMSIYENRWITAFY